MDPLILTVGALAASVAMTLVFLVLLFLRLPKLFARSASSKRKLHDSILLAAYALFPIQAFANFAAAGGLMGDGATSMFLHVTPTTLVLAPIVQVALFALWALMRFTTLRDGRFMAGILTAVPVFVPIAYLAVWIGWTRQ